MIQGTYICTEQETLFRNPCLSANLLRREKSKYCYDFPATEMGFVCGFHFQLNFLLWNFLVQNSKRQQFPSIHQLESNSFLETKPLNFLDFHDNRLVRLEIKFLLSLFEKSKGRANCIIVAKPMVGDLIEPWFGYRNDLRQSNPQE